MTKGEEKGNMSNNTNFEFSVEEISPKKKARSKTSPVMAREKCNAVVKAIGENTGLALNDSMALVSLLCQRGGTNRNAIKASTTATYSGKTLNAEQFFEFCKSAGGGTPRQFARTMADVIFNFALALDEEGDLSRQMKLEIPTISRTQEIWCSNFQTNNTNCDELVRNWLVNNYKRRFN